MTTGEWAFALQGAPLSVLDTPAVIVDLDVLDANIAAMSTNARLAGTRLRPHAKTHKSPWIAAEQLRQGAAGVAVATLGEAAAMHDAGIDDLLIAFPIVGASKLERLRPLAEQAHLTVLVDSMEVAVGLQAIGRHLSSPLDCYVEVDSGHHRCGLPPGPAAAELVLRVMELQGLHVRGLLTHAGQIMLCEDPADLRRIALGEADALAATAADLSRRGVHVPEQSIGSTASAYFLGEVKASYPGVSEVRPGRYVFGDADLVAIGVTAEDRCALHVLTTVVSRPTADRIVVDAGSKTLGGNGGVRSGFGRVVGGGSANVDRLSEEHGILSVSEGSVWSVGDRLRIIPNHACVTTNLCDSMVGIRHGVVERLIPVTGRGRDLWDRASL